METAKTTLESQTKQEKDRAAKLEKELEAARKEKKSWESKVADLDLDQTVCSSLQPAT